VRARCRAAPPLAGAGGRRPQQPGSSVSRCLRRFRAPDRPRASLRWEGGTLPARRACQRGQGRAASRPLPGAPRRRTDTDACSAGRSAPSTISSVAWRAKTRTGDR
jgi:hypothetical protein